MTCWLQAHACAAVQAHCATSYVWTMLLQDHDLDFQKLLDASAYKEKYRADMIAWGEAKRKQDPEYFCHLATSGKGSEKPVWIISDARRKTDVDYFRQHYPKETVTVRITADLDVREKRDFVFTAGKYLQIFGGCVLLVDWDLGEPSPDLC